MAYNIFGKMYYEIEKATAGLFEEEVPYVKARKTAAKQCALIAVDEVIKSIPCIPSPIPCEDINDCIIQARKFWQEVKKEIKKI